MGNLEVSKPRPAQLQGKLKMPVMYTSEHHPKRMGDAALVITDHSDGEPEPSEDKSYGIYITRKGTSVELQHMCRLEPEEDDT
eukprot:1819592-Pyramimonas_sp.AAC.1